MYVYLPPKTNVFDPTTNSYRLTQQYEIGFFEKGGWYLESEQTNQNVACIRVNWLNGGMHQNNINDFLNALNRT